MHKTPDPKVSLLLPNKHKNIGTSLKSSYYNPTNKFTLTLTLYYMSYILFKGFSHEPVSHFFSPSLPTLGMIIQ